MEKHVHHVDLLDEGTVQVLHASVILGQLGCDSDPLLEIVVVDVIATPLRDRFVSKLSTKLHAEQGDRGGEIVGNKSRHSERGPGGRCEGAWMKAVARVSAGAGCWCCRCVMSSGGDLSLPGPPGWNCREIWLPLYTKARLKTGGGKKARGRCVVSL